MADNNKKIDRAKQAEEKRKDFSESERIKEGVVKIDPEGKWPPPPPEKGKK